MESTLIKQQVYNYLNELEQTDSSMEVDFSPNGDEDINLTALGEVVLTKFEVEVSSVNEDNVFQWVYDWSLMKRYLF